MDCTKIQNKELVKLLITQAQRVATVDADQKIFAAARNEVLRRLREWEPNVKEAAAKSEPEKPATESKPRSYRSRKKKSDQ